MLSNEWEHKTVMVSPGLYLHIRIRLEKTLDQMGKLYSEILGYVYSIRTEDDTCKWCVLRPDAHGNIAEIDPAKRFLSQADAIWFLIDFVTASEVAAANCDLVGHEEGLRDLRAEITAS